ncbi:Metallo-dependent phosphatase [Polychaeton citri CBS 116435]|uniref:Metallo-dependent phosphatase n=1 Tax=Polychaeton citri CBS 116435 TaxID=1314669 RepID=A0A9P4UIQ3_9PEZI|nr:Metallo-dependent phosphatase [Polychaeton citri CBS 116435]
MVRMTRRITRTLGQIAGLAAIFFTFVLLVDSRYRVLPSSIHHRLPSHHTGSVITDVTISSCSTLNPLSSCRLDPDVWHRVEKDLHLQTGWVQSAWLHVQRKKEDELTADDKVVVGLRVSRLDPSVGEKGEHKERWESRPGGIWILRSNKRHDSDSDKVVTAIDVLFGSDAVEPRPGWTLVSNPLLLDAGDDIQVARISIRNGAPQLPKEIQPRVRKDGRFKIIQISDAHLATGVGKCRDAIGKNNQPSKHCEADPRTMEFLERVLDEEKPDMVVLSGDQVEGPAAPDTQTAIFKIAAPLIERQIPYAAIFGNHDDEGSKSLPRAVQMALMQTLPYSLSQPGPEQLEGVGNYYVEVIAPGQSRHSALTLYFLDTHSLSPDEKHYRGYDWLKPKQIEWFRSTSQGLKREHAKYSHIHMDMAFIHIPLPEYREADNILAGGKFVEPVTAPGFNTHFYDALHEEGIVAVGCGHDHVNDYCALRPLTSNARRDGPAKQHGGNGHDSSPKKTALGPWMCYAGGSGFGGYGGYGGYHRRLRVWDIDTNVGRITTWKRLECCDQDTTERVDEVVIVEAGHAVAP